MEKGAAEEEVVSKNGEKKRKPEDVQKCETSNGSAKKLKISTDEEEAAVQQNSKSEEVESGDDDSVTGVVDENQNSASDGEPKTERDTLNSLTLAVVPEGFPEVKMTEEQAERVEAALVASIKPTDRGQQPVQISKTQYENGALVFTCVNRKTHSWLQRTVRKIVPWPGARFEVGQAETTLNGSKFILWVNHKMGVSKRSYQQILELIEKQNKGISTTEWRVIRGVAETDRNERLVLWVDNTSLEDLKAQDFKLFLGLDQAKLVKMSEWRKMNSGPPAVQYPSAPKFPNDNYPPPLLPGLVSRPARRSRGSGRSAQNPRQSFNRFERRDWPRRRELVSVDTGTRLRGAQFTTTDVIPSREFMYTNRGSRFPGRRRPRRRGFPTSERSQLREVSYIRREPRYTSNRSQ